MSAIEFPPDGIRRDGIVLRLVTEDDAALAARAFADADIAERANLPPWDEDELHGFLASQLDDAVASGTMVPTIVQDAESGDALGGASIQNVDRTRSIADVGYWLFPEARGRGAATSAARAIAEYGFSLGIARIQAYVNVGNVDSERVLERAGFTREGVLRSMPRIGRPRVDQTIFSLLRGE